MTDVAVIFGTRPELVKVAPVVAALRQTELRVAIAATCQHRELLDVPLFGRLGPVTMLDAENTSIPKFMATAIRACRTWLQGIAPRVVLVQGDTMSALAGAIAARDLELPIAHVEAGVRSGNMRDPWPEEQIRVDIDRLATWRYAPTPLAARWLSATGLDCVVTGNTSIDALLETGVQPKWEASPTLLVTLHRRELRQRDDAVHIVQAIANAVRDNGVNAIWPVHPAMVHIAAQVSAGSWFSMRPPMSYDVMLRTLSEARGVLTDSGGLVEEAATLGVPTAILRGANDRAEAVEAGIARQYVPSPSEAAQAIGMLTRCELARTPTPVFGDGAAAPRIAAHLAEMLRQG